MWLLCWIFWFNQRAKEWIQPNLTRTLIVFVFVLGEICIDRNVHTSKRIFIHTRRNVFERILLAHSDGEFLSILRVRMSFSEKISNFFLNPELMLFLKKHIRMLMTRTGLRIRLHMIKGRKKMVSHVKTKRLFFTFSFCSNKSPQRAKYYLLTIRYRFSHFSEKIISTSIIAANICVSRFANRNKKNNKMKTNWNSRL